VCFHGYLVDIWWRLEEGLCILFDSNEDGALRQSVSWSSPSQGAAFAHGVQLAAGGCVFLTGLVGLDFEENRGRFVKLTNGRFVKLVSLDWMKHEGR
jgi:hypothetical protein